MEQRSYDKEFKKQAIRLSDEIIRRAWARNEHAIETVLAHEDGGGITLPHRCDERLFEELP